MGELVSVHVIPLPHGELGLTPTLRVLLSLDPALLLAPPYLGFQVLAYLAAEGMARLEAAEALQIENGRLADEGPMTAVTVHRLMTDAVVETPHGAHFTACVPDYGRDEAFQKEYAAARAPLEAAASGDDPDTARNASELLNQLSRPVQRGERRTGLFRRGRPRDSR